MRYLTIDGGTTNTRIRYIEKDRIHATYKSNVGVKDTAIKGTLKYLKQSLKEGISSCLKEVNITLDDIDGIIGTGMITSNLGICEIRHLETPVDISRLAESVVEIKFDEIVNKPIYFIPGVKNNVENLSIKKFESIDMMRGEEVEAFGALSIYKKKSKTIYISPGSHTKFVFIDEHGKIEKCSTTLTGEILWALSQETILAQSINNDLVTEIESEFFLKGFESASKNGFTKTCFLVRIMDTFIDSTSNQRANFLTGALIYEDIKSINDALINKEHEIIIGGKHILRQLYKLALEKIKYDMKKVTLLRDDEVEILSSIGAIKIFEVSKSPKGAR